MAEGAADGEHDKHADVLLDGGLKDGLARGLIEQVKADHDDIPDAVGDGAFQHLMLEIAAPVFGDADEADFPFVAQVLHKGRNLAQVIVVLRGAQAVQVIDIDIVGAEAAQAVVQASAQLGACDTLAAQVVFWSRR